MLRPVIPAGSGSGSFEDAAGESGVAALDTSCVVVIVAAIAAARGVVVAEVAAPGEPPLAANSLLGANSQNVSMRQHTSEYVSIRQHASAYISMRQHLDANALLPDAQMLTYADVCYTKRMLTYADVCYT